MLFASIRQFPERRIHAIDKEMRTTYMAITLTQLLDKMFAGDEVALARLMTLVEREGREVGPILEAIAPRLGKAFTIGITGPPGQESPA